MATPILDNLNIELSYKIFDPVETAEANGEIFSNFLRVSYINRAYSKLIRTLEIVHPDINAVVSNFYQLLPVQTYLQDALPLPENIDPFELYYRPNERGQLTKAKSITAPEYLSVKAGRDSFYTPTLSERYWTIINGYIKVLPENITAYYDCQAMVKQNYTTIGGDIDINIPANYYDMVLNLAAMEAMADKGDFQTYQIYANMFNNDIAMIARLKVKTNE